MLRNKFDRFVLADIFTTDPIDKLKGKMSVDKAPEQFLSTASSFYGLMLVIGIIGIVSTLVFTGIRLAHSKNSTKRSEVKDALIFKCAIAVVIFALPTFVGMYHTIVYTISLG